MACVCVRHVYVIVQNLNGRVQDCCVEECKNYTSYVHAIFITDYCDAIKVNDNVCLIRNTRIHWKSTKFINQPGFIFIIIKKMNLKYTHSFIFNPDQAIKFKSWVKKYLSR